MRIDYSGMFWEKIGQFFCETWNSIKTWASNTFGAGCTTTSTIAEVKTEIVPSPSPVTVEAGTITTQIVEEYGDSSKPFSVYANEDLEHPIISSSVGLKINILDFTLDISLGLDNIGISGSVTNGDVTDSVGFRANLSELKVGVETSTAIRWEAKETTTYTNTGVNGWAIIYAYLLLTTGQSMPQPAYTN